MASSAAAMDKDRVEGEGFELETMLHLATKEGNLVAVRRMIAQGVDVNKNDVDLYTPLHRACDRQDAECVEMLLAAKADPNVSHPGLDGWTPLHVSAWRNDAKCAALLLKAGSDRTVMDWYGQTPMEWAGGDVQALFAEAQEVKPAGPSKEEDLYASLRDPCVMKPSAIHLANIERCLRAADEHGIDQGGVCANFDKNVQVTA